MWRKIIGFVVAAGSAAACVPAPPSSERVAETVVLTKHAPGVDFSTYRTFFLRPEIREIDDEGVTPLPESVAGPLLDETTKQMTDRGYEAAATKDEADLAVEMLYINTQWVASSCYSWWDPYYWGYPGYPYYPYYGGCSASTWQTHTLSTTLVDLTPAKNGSPTTAALTDGAAPLPDAGGTPPTMDSGLKPPGVVLGGVWYSAVYGVVYGTTADSVQKGLDGIDQAFVQSPYLTNVK